MLAKVIKAMPPFQSITGENEKFNIDSEGNSEGSFTAYAFMKKTYTHGPIKFKEFVNGTNICVEKNFTCSHFLDKVILIKQSIEHLLPLN